MGTSVDITDGDGRVTPRTATAGLLYVDQAQIGSGTISAGERSTDSPENDENREMRGLRRSAPDRIRTCDLRFRRPTLYPAELRAQ
jgi:hypothetical protein